MIYYFAFFRDTQNYNTEVLSWMVEMDSCLTDSGKLVDNLNQKCSMLVHGIRLGWTISHHVKTVMNFHVALAKPMNKTSVLALCKMIEMLKVG